MEWQVLCNFFLSSQGSFPEVIVPLLAYLLWRSVKKIKIRGIVFLQINKALVTYEKWLELILIMAWCLHIPFSETMMTKMPLTATKPQGVNTLKPRQNGLHFADDTFKCIFLNGNAWISIMISLKFVPKGPINNILTMAQIMAWRRPWVFLPKFSAHTLSPSSESSFNTQPE